MMKTQHTLRIAATCAVLSNRDLLAETIKQLPEDTEVRDIAKTSEGWELGFATAGLGELSTVYLVDLIIKPKLRPAIKTSLGYKP